MVPVVDAGVVVTLFSKARAAMAGKCCRSRSSLLAPAQEHGWPVIPAWIHYAVPDGSAANDVCYWGDMTFLPHFLKICFP